jgi:O-antigen ligase
MNKIEISGYLKDFKSKSLLILFCLALLLLVINNYLLVGIFALLLFLLTVIISDKVLIAFTIISFLALPSTVSSDLRVILQVFNFSVLVLMFINKYGLQLKNYPGIPKIVGLLIFFILFSMSVSTLFSDYRMLGINQIVRTAIFFVLIYLYYSLLTNKTDVYLYIGCIVFTSVIFSLIQFYELFQTGFSIIVLATNQLVTVGNDYLHHNFLGAFWVITICLLIGYFYITNNTKNRFLIIFCVIILFINLVLSNSRAAFISLAAGLFFIFYKFDKKKLTYFLILIILIIPLLFIPQVNKFVDIYFRVEEQTSGRNYLLNAGFNVIKNNPVFGAGPAATKFEMYKYLPFLYGSPEELYVKRNFYMTEFGQTHNFYLFFFSDLGILGFLTALSLPVIFMFIGLKTLQKYKYSDTIFKLLVVLIGSGICLFVRGIFEWSGLISYGYILMDLPFWLLFIILIYIYCNEPVIFKENM